MTTLMAENTTRGDASTPRKRTTQSTEAGGRKRDSRAGTRKVTCLSAEQLERKRANDREAQRTIRQRTKEHIEKLESQVAELSARDEQMDKVLERNAELEVEISYLRQQLSLLTNRPLNSLEDTDESRRSSTSSTAASIMSSPFHSPHIADTISVAATPLSGRIGFQHAWQSYGATPPPSASASHSNGGDAEASAFAMGEPFTPTAVPPVLSGYAMSTPGMYSIPDSYQTAYGSGTQGESSTYSMPQIPEDRQVPTSSLDYPNGAIPTTSVQEYQDPASLMSAQPNPPTLRYHWPPQS